MLTYRRSDGTIARELRRPEQVFRAESMASLADAPLTDLHPKVMVNPGNARELGHGHVSQSTVRADGRFVTGEVVVTDAGMIGAIEAGKRREVSCGYNCKLVVGAGTWNGEHYDAEQTDIVYNHVGIGPTNWGRAGSDVALRLDGAAEELPSTDTAWLTDAADAPEPAPQPQPEKGNTMELVTIRVDSIDVQVPQSAAQLVNRALADRDAAVTAAKAEASGHKARLDALQGELDGTKVKLTEATDPRRFDTAVTDRIALLERARLVLGTETKLDGKSARDIKELVVKKLDPSVDFAGKSDEYVQGRFDAADVPQTPSALDEARRHLQPRRDGGGGGGQPPTFTPPAWRKPLASVRG